MAESAVDITERQMEYVKGIAAGLSYEDAARDAGYEMPVFEMITVYAYRLGCVPIRENRIGTLRWLLPQTVDDDYDRT